jgi:hypothetical protein
MALADPTSLTIATVATPFARLSTEENKSVYKDATGNWKLTVSHLYNKRTRRSFRLDYTKTGANPLFPSQNETFSMSAYMVVDVPPVGFTATEQQNIVKAVADFLAVAANIDKFNQGQN